MSLGRPGFDRAVKRRLALDGVSVVSMDLGRTACQRPFWLLTVTHRACVSALRCLLPAEMDPVSDSAQEELVLRVTAWARRENASISRALAGG